MTDKDRDACRDKIASLRSEGIYTPPNLEGTVAIPGNAGGMNWSGMSFDPIRQLLFTNTNNLPLMVKLVKLIPRDKFNAMRDTGGLIDLWANSDGR
ncbi:MAG: hypothetical protein J2P21_04340 [Chloracidobacterium sp.]|nr:hypothetical protein [Chloracidobacterium sp.]